MNRRDLTEEEIKTFPLELKVCYMIIRWNNGFKPNSTDEWAEGIGWLKFKNNEIDITTAIGLAKKEALDKIEFIKKFII